MEKIIEIKHEYNTLDKLHRFLDSETAYNCYLDYDKWDFRINNKGKMEQCIVLQKSTMHALKLYFTNENKVKASYIIPNTIMNSFFGKRIKARRNIIEIVSGKIKDALLASPQLKAFEELEAVVYKAT